jgi:2-succinyl-6-hydroxy-2,4-cyclohexadiene-1-carboxylate synthase
MAHLFIDDIAYNVETVGTGPPVVLLHGFTGSRTSWQQLTAALGHHFTCVIPDHIGHGLSGAPRALERYQMRRVVDDLVEVVRASGYERAAWLGYSMGGRTALQVAVHRPEAVSALILEGASPGLADDAERADRRAADDALAERIEAEGVDWFADYWGALPLWDTQASLNPVIRVALRQQRMAQRAVGLANSLRGMGAGAQEAVWDRLGEVRIPVQLIAGDLDEKYTAIAREMAVALPNATIELIEDAGHAAHLEQADAFAAVVLDFLRRAIEGSEQPSTDGRRAT